MTRSASRAASEGPSDAGSDLSSVAGSETPSARARRYEARNRNSLAGRGSDAYGTKRRVRSSKLTFQATQGHAASAMSNTIGRGLGLEDVPEEGSSDADDDQYNMDNQLHEIDRQQVVGGPFGRLTNWLKNVVRDDGERARVRAAFETPGFGPYESAGSYDPSFGPPMTPTSSSGTTSSTDQTPLPLFARFKRVFVALIMWLLQSATRIVFLLAFGFVVLSLVDLYLGPIPGYDLDLLKTRFGLGQSRCPAIQSYNDRHVLSRLNMLDEALLRGAPVTRPTHPVPRVDYFSPQNAAVVVPSLTSPQKKRKVRGLKSLFVSEVEYKREIPIVGPFQDLKKKWCAPSRHGKAQITVSMAALMAPQSLVVRQEPHQAAALDPSTYPKEIELWVEILDANNRAAIAERIERLHPGITQSPVRQLGRQLDQAQSLPDTFVPIGRWQYELGSHKPAEQHFLVDFDIFWDWNESTNRAAVRVNSNWGDTEATCVHELKLHGRYLDRPRKFEIVDGEGQLEVEGKFEVK